MLNLIALPKIVAMLNAVIIENEKPAIEKLVNTLSGIASDVNVMATLDRVDASIDYISHAPSVDLIFSTILLEDGLAFKIFDQTNSCTPVIFITDQEEFMLNAFEYNCIAYLLKPVDPERLGKALTKYRMLHNQLSYERSLHNVPVPVNGKHVKHRMLVKKEKENISLPISDIVLFYTEHRSVFVVDRMGKEYIIDKNLCDIEQELGKDSFFRVNRQYIVNIDFIHGFKSYDKVKLLVELTLPKFDHQVIVSQEMAPQFREWMYNA